MEKKIEDEKQRKRGRLDDFKNSKITNQRTHFSFIIVWIWVEFELRSSCQYLTPFMKSFLQMGQKKKKITAHIFQHVVISDKDKVACAHKNTQKAFIWGRDLLRFGKSEELGRKHLRTSNLNTDTLVWKREQAKIESTRHSSYKI